MTDDSPPDMSRLQQTPAVQGFRFSTVAGTLALAVIGGALAKLAGLPLPWLVGAQMMLCAVALFRLKIFGAAPQFPRSAREVTLPVFGVIIGGAFSADVIAQAPGWWPSLLALSVFLILVHSLVYRLFRRIGGYDRPTAYFASFPGGFIESVILGMEAGGNQRLIQVQHFLRISLIVLIVPLAFWWQSGHMVGSAAGANIGSGKELIGIEDATILAIAGLAGTLLGRWLKVPAPDISGAIFASAAMYVSGFVEGSFPPILIAVIQLIIGTSLGVGFVGISRRELARAFGLAISAFLIVFTLALAVAVLLSRAVGAEVESLVLAFAPGGLAEMSLVAVSLHLSVPFVTLHHLYRIFFTLAVLSRLYRR